MNASSSSTTEYYAVGSNSQSDNVKKLIIALAFYWQIVVSTIAVFLNVIVFVTFLRVPDVLPARPRVLMIHQSILETVCSLSALYKQFLQSSWVNFQVSNSLGMFLCALSCSYWASAYCVMLNCLVTTIDRYLAVCHPLTTKLVLTTRSLLLIMLSNDCLMLAGAYTNCMLTIKVDPYGNLCVNLPGSAHITQLYGLVALFVVWLPPPLTVLLLYPQMIGAVLLSDRSFRNSAHAPEKQRSRAAKRLIRTLLIGAVALFVSVTPNVVFYNVMSCLLRLSTSNLGSYQQSVNVICVSSYALLSPVIYSFSTARFRQAVVIAFALHKFPACSSLLAKCY